MSKIAIDDLREGMISNQTICNERGTILVAQGVSLTTSNIKRLRTLNITIVDIKDDESIDSCSVLTPTTQKAISSIKGLSDSLFDLKTVNIKNNIAAIEEVMHSVLDRPFIQEFLETCSNNELLYQHSLRTAILSTNMGIIKGYDTLNLTQLATSAILHDCGMGEEFNEDEEHAFLGFIKLREKADVDMTIALVCLQHHERYNGNGFPFAFVRTQISEFASLLAVVDHYDRLIMKKYDPRKALFETVGQKNTHFDPIMIDLFASTIDWPRIYNIHSSFPSAL